MKRYFVKHPRNFSNEYTLCWVNSNSAIEVEAVKNGYMRITRKEAVNYCINERYARKINPAFSGYGNAVIMPYGVGEWEKYNYSTIDGYVFE